MASSAQTRVRRGRRLDQEAWVRAALDTLWNEGIHQVRIERLARRLGVTKGSFYWHFRDRQDLLDSLLDYWVHSHTDPVIELAEHFRGDARARIYAVVEDVLRHDRAGYDLAIRAWARTDPRAEDCVRVIDDRRLRFLTGLFADLGLDAEEAEQRARLLYYYMLGEAAALNKEQPEQRLRTMRRKVDILLEPCG